MLSTTKHSKDKNQRKTPMVDAFSYSTIVTLTLDLSISKLLFQLLLTSVTSRLSMNVIWFSVFELTVSTGQTDYNRRGK